MTTWSTYTSSRPYNLEHFLEAFESEGGDPTKITLYLSERTLREQDVSNDRIRQLRDAGWRIWLGP